MRKHKTVKGNIVENVPYSERELLEETLETLEEIKTLLQKIANKLGV